LADDTDIERPHSSLATYVYAAREAFKVLKPLSPPGGVMFLVSEVPLYRERLWGEAAFERIRRHARQSRPDSGLGFTPLRPLGNHTAPLPRQASAIADLNLEPHTLNPTVQPLNP